ncbi:kinase [Thraustotheca clavata]|uniref:Kinase n=1 Tax=Thraustotheca clavata TaxID=74557 RepID=A0A1W0A399_9STRA|nr:kinase [Thraustotheca clavata]
MNNQPCTKTLNYTWCDHEQNRFTVLVWNTTIALEEDIVKNATNLTIVDNEYAWEFVPKVEFPKLTTLILDGLTMMKSLETIKNAKDVNVLVVQNMNHIYMDLTAYTKLDILNFINDTNLTSVDLPFNLKNNSQGLRIYVENAPKLNRSWGEVNYTVFDGTTIKPNSTTSRPPSFLPAPTTPVSASSSGTSGTSALAVIAIILSVVASFVLIMVAIFWLRRRRMSEIQGRAIGDNRGSFTGTRLSNTSIADRRKMSGTVLDASLCDTSLSAFPDFLRLTPPKSMTNVKASRHLLQGVFEERDVVVKYISKSSKDVDEFIEDLYQVSNIQHVNVVMFIGVASFPRLDEKCVGAVAEFMEKGSLASLLYSKKVVLDEDTEWNMCMDSIAAVQYVHGRNRSIPSLSSRKFLVNADMQVKLNIFSLLSYKDLKLAEMNYGSNRLSWKAPEVLRNDSVDEYAADIYSLGLLIAEVFTRTVPFVAELKLHGNVGLDLLLIEHAGNENKMIVPFDMESMMKYPEDLQSLLWRCWHFDPSYRPTAEEVMAVMTTLYEDRYVYNPQQDWKCLNDITLTVAINEHDKNVYVNLKTAPDFINVDRCILNSNYNGLKLDQAIANTSSMQIYWQQWKLSSFNLESIGKFPNLADLQLLGDSNLVTNITICESAALKSVLLKSHNSTQPLNVYGPKSTIFKGQDDITLNVIRKECSALPNGSLDKDQINRTISTSDPASITSAPAFNTSAPAFNTGTIESSSSSTGVIAGVCVACAAAILIVLFVFYRRRMSNRTKLSLPLTDSNYVELDDKLIPDDNNKAIELKSPRSFCKQMPSHTIFGPLLLQINGTLSVVRSGHRMMWCKDVNNNKVLLKYTEVDDIIKRGEFTTAVKSITNIQHPNLLPLLGVSLINSNACFAAVTEFAEKGSLSLFLLEPKMDLTRDIRIRFCKEITNAVQYLHHSKRAFPNLNSQKVLVTESLTCKLNTFELLKPDYFAKSHPLQSFGSFTIPYLAPELILSSQAVPTPASNVYSIGILFGEICTRTPPFTILYQEFGFLGGDVKLMEIIQSRKRLPFPFDQDQLKQTTSVQFVAMLKRCLSPVPSDRPTIDVLMAELQNSPTTTFEYLSNATTAYGLQITSKSSVLCPQIQVISFPFPCECFNTTLLCSAESTPAIEPMITVPSSIKPPTSAALSAGAIVGSALGALALVFILTLIALYYRRRHHNNHLAQSDGEPNEELETEFIEARSPVRPRRLFNSLVASLKDPCQIFRDAFPDFTIPIEKEKTAKILTSNSMRSCFSTELNIKLALKSIKTTDVDERKQEFIQSIDFLRSIEPHPNLVALVGVSLINYRTEFALAVEFVQRGSLSTILHDKRNEVVASILEPIGVAMDIAQGLLALHSIQLSYGHLESKNVLVDKQFHCKLNLLKLLPTARHCTQSFGGPSKSYFAPEILCNERVDMTKADIYAFGVVLGEVVTQRWPYEVHYENHGFVEGDMLLLNREAGEPFPDLNPSLITGQIAITCMDPSPHARPSVDVLVKLLESHIVNEPIR